MLYSIYSKSASKVKEKNQILTQANISTELSYLIF